MPILFTDLFNFEWILQGSGYHSPSLGYQYGKWHVLEYMQAGWSGDLESQLEKLYITKQNPIDTDSLYLEFDASAPSVGYLPHLWGPMWLSAPPANPAHLRVLFRIDEWTYSPHVTIIGGSGSHQGALTKPYLGVGLAKALGDLHLWVRTDLGSNGTFQELRAESQDSVPVTLGTIHMLEIGKNFDPINGWIRVWLDGQEITEWVEEYGTTPLSLIGLDTGFASGLYSPQLGVAEMIGTGYMSVGTCKMAIDNFIYANERIGVSPFEPTLHKLLVDSNPQGKTVRVGNHFFVTPVEILVPDGTIPKIGLDYVGFDHWELEGVDYDAALKTLFSSNTNIETWPFTELVATATRVLNPENPGGVGFLPTPPISCDTVITGVYTGASRNLLALQSTPSAEAFVDGISWTTPKTDHVYSGKRLIGAHDRLDR